MTRPAATRPMTRPTPGRPMTSPAPGRRVRRTTGSEAGSGGGA